MKLIEINKNGTTAFLLNDGRTIKSYRSGYVRINTPTNRWYQINKKISIKDEYWTGYWHGRGHTDTTIYNYERVLIPNELDRLEYIINFVKNNINE